MIPEDEYYNEYYDDGYHGYAFEKAYPKEYVQYFHEEDPTTGETLDYITVANDTYVPFQRHIDTLNKYVETLQSFRCATIHLTSLMKGLNKILEELDRKDEYSVDGISDEEIEIWNKIVDVAHQATVDAEFCAIEIREDFRDIMPE